VISWDPYIFVCNKYLWDGQVWGLMSVISDTGDRDWKDQGSRPDWVKQKVSETLSQQINLVWWHAQVIPSSQEA
jgi:hypothetical protein